MVKMVANSERRVATSLIAPSRWISAKLVPAWAIDAGITITSPADITAERAALIAYHTSLGHKLAANDAAVVSLVSSKVVNFSPSVTYVTHVCRFLEYFRELGERGCRTACSRLL